MKGELILKDTLEMENSEFDLAVSFQDFGLEVYVEEDNSLENHLQDKELFLKCKEDNVSALEEIGGDENLEEEIIWMYIEHDFDNILNEVEFIKLNFEEIEPLEYIRKNPIIMTKKIVLNEVVDITDYEKLVSIAEKYKDIKDNIYLKLIGNNNYVSLNDCFKTMDAIKQQANEIVKLNLSPMETIMYVYDQVRNRVYTFEDENESVFKSRDLTEVLFGDKIVCSGYSHMFFSLLKYLGIKNDTATLYKDDINGRGHQRNIIYVQDPKYNIDGVYYFDPTWDSKNKEDDNTYLYHYCNFAKIRSYMETKEKQKYQYYGFNKYSDSLYDEIEEIIESGDYTLLKPYLSTVNYMATCVNEPKLLQYNWLNSCSFLCGKFGKYEFLIRLKKITLKFNKEIPAETMIKLLLNVRKIEYYQNPEWYPYSISAIYTIFNNSKWNFQNTHLNSEEKLLKVIFGEVPEHDTMTDFKNYMQESNGFKEIEQVRLTKVLQKYLENKRK